MIYLLLKSLHLIAVIAWMTGMLYLPRLFVYHCEAEIGNVAVELCHHRPDAAFGDTA